MPRRYIKLLSANALLRGSDWHGATVDLNKDILVPRALRDVEGKVVAKPVYSDRGDAELAGLDVVVRQSGHAVIVVPEASRLAPGHTADASRAHATLFNSVHHLIEAVLLDAMAPPDVIGTVIEGGREVYLHPLLARLLQGLLARKLSRSVEPVLPATTLAFRPLDGVRSGLFGARALLRRGYTWGARADIRGYFPAVTFDHVVWALERLAPIDSTILKLLEWMMAAPILRAANHPRVLAGMVGIRSAPLHALYQGGVIAPVLSNVVGAACFDLPFATAMSGHGAVMLRYADDILVLARSQAVAAEALELVHGLAQARSFEIHTDPAKTSPEPVDLGVDDISWLGYELGSGRVRLSDTTLAEVVDDLASVSPTDPLQFTRFVDAVLRLAFDRADRVEELTEKVRHLGDYHQRTIAAAVCHVKTQQIRTTWIARWQRHVQPILAGAR